MPEPPIAPQIHQSLDIHGYLGSQFAFHLACFIDGFTNLVDFSIGQIIRLRTRINVQGSQNFFRRYPTDTVNIRQPDFDPFPVR